MLGGMAHLSILDVQLRAKRQLSQGLWLIGVEGISIRLIQVETKTRLAHTIIPRLFHSVLNWRLICQDSNGAAIGIIGLTNVICVSSSPGV